MNNLKRVLSVGLSGAMLAGMMVVGASAADFKDADEIEHTDAVNTLVALNVINGKDDGSYDPNGIVTRAEMAKLITVTLNGGKDPVIGTKTTPTYTDIKGHWAESYIEYCSSLDIINGRGDGTFAPDATVTGSEAAKMMLVAMGWDSTIFNFTGVDWALNVGVEANKIDLYEDLEDVNVSEGLTRDNTAQLIYNGILAKTMEKSPSMTITNGEITWGYNLVDDTLFETKFGGQVWIGTFAGNDRTITSLEDGSIRVYGKLEDAETAVPSKNADFPAELDIANIGEEVKVLFKDGTSGTKNQPDKNDTIYGVFNTGATTVVTGIRADVKDQKSNKAQVNIGGTKYDTKDTVNVYTNYVLTGSNLVADNGTSSANSALTAALKPADNTYVNGDTIKAVTDPDDGKIETIYITASKIAAVTAKNSEKVSLNNGVGTITLEDNEVYEGIAKGDVVVVTTLYATSAASDDAYSIVKKAEVVTGTVNGYKDVTNVTVDGTAYKIYNKAGLLNAIPDQTVTTAFGDTDIGEEFDLYLVNGYVGAAVQVSESASNYSLVTAVKTSGSTSGVFNNLQLQVLGADGVKTIITVSDDSAKGAASDYKVGDIITYTGSESDAVVKIEASVDPANTTKAYNDNTKAFDGAVTTANAVLFAEVTVNAVSATSNDGSANPNVKYKAYDIRSLDGFTATTTTVVHNADGKAVAVFADLDNTPAGATDTTVYGIVTAANGRVEIDGSYYYQYVVASNGETYTVNVADNILAGGKLVSFDPSSDNTYAVRDITIISSGAVYVKEHNEADGTLTYFTAKTGTAGNWAGDNTTKTTLALDKDCAIVYVNADDGAAGSEIGVNAFDSVTGYKNAVIVTKQDGTETVIVAIFVETSNKCDALGEKGFEFGIVANASSSNINVVFSDGKGNWLNADEIAALGITDDMITVKVNGTEKSLKALATDTTKGYNWNGTATCIVDDSCTSAATALNNYRTALSDDDVCFLKISTDDNFTSGESVTVEIANNTNLYFVAREAYTVQ